MEKNVVNLMPVVGTGAILSVGQKSSQSANRQLKIVGTEVFFADQVIDLADFHLTLRLFRLYAIAKGGSCSLKEILAFVYRVQPGEANTPRFRKSARVRAVKLLSRARSLALKNFDDDLEWFSYDHKTRTWALYKGCDASRERYLYS